MSVSGYVIGRIEAEATRALRRRVLRNGDAGANVVYDGDAAPGSVHFGAMTEGGEIVGVASIYVKTGPEKYRWVHDGLGDEHRVWQLRGMATAQEVRGSGVGGAILAACLAHARAQGGRFFWCNARLGVKGFYERYGLKVAGDVFDIAGIGPHVWMWCGFD